MSGGADEHRVMFRFLNEIGIIAQLAGNAFERVMPGAMTLPQFVVLNHMVRLGDHCTPLGLSRAMQVAKGAMTNTLGHLSRSGFVVITPDADDGRSKRVGLTAAGRAAHGDAVASMGPALAYLLGIVPAERVAAVLPMLEEVRRALDRRRD